MVSRRGIGRATGARVASYAFVVTVEDALRRNALRDGGGIDDVGIFSVAKKLVLPTEAERFDHRFARPTGSSSGR